MQCSTVKCSILEWSVLHCTALNCTALNFTALNCTALNCTALHCTDCTALQVNSFAQFYKNRLWRNEVEHKKRERIKQNAADRRTAQKFFLIQVQD